MKIRIILRNVLILLIILLNIGCDQYTKNIARKRIEYHQTITVVDDFLTLTKVENSGAFLSLGSNMPVFIKFISLNLMPLMVLLWGVYILIEKTHISTALAIGLCSVIGGGAGNLYDRIRFGSVTDFLHLNFGIFQTGIFNMADVSIMVGMMLIFSDLIVKRLIYKV